MHILLVEDSRSFAQISRRTLEQHGHDVKHATSLAEAADMLDPIPDAMVLDLDLGDDDMDGPVRAAIKLFQGPIVVLTGHEVDPLDYLALGVDEVLAKRNNDHLLLHDTLARACKRYEGVCHRYTLPERS